MIFLGENALLVRLTSVGLVCLIATASFLFCSESAIKEDLPIDYPRDSWKFLVSGDDSSLVRHFRELGNPESVRRFNMLFNHMKSEEDRHEARRRKLEAPLKRAAWALAAAFHEEAYGIRLANHLAKTPEERRRWRELKKASLRVDPELPPEQRLELRRGFRDAFLKEGNLESAALMEEDIAQIIDGQGRVEESIPHWRMGIEYARRAHYTTLLCQLLGTLSIVYGKLDQVDSMWALQDQALAVARRARQPQHAARILSFKASSAFRRGRPALAMEYSEQAQAVCREYKGGADEVRFIIRAAELYDALGLWNSVERHLNRAQVLFREITFPTPYVSYHRYVIFRDLQARVLESRGLLDDAIRHYERYDAELREKERADGTLEKMSWMPFYARYLFDWGHALLEAGRSEEAMALVERGRQKDPDSPKFLYLRALISMQRHDDAEALASIAAFQNSADSLEARFRQDVVKSDLIVARIAARRGDGGAQKKALQKCLDRLGQYMPGLDAGASGYLFFSQARDVREALHGVVDGSAAAGYELELAWRELPQLLGRDFPPSAEVPQTTPKTIADLKSLLDPPSSSRAPARTARLQSRLRDLDAVHLLYSVNAGRVMRWIATGRTVACDTLAVSSQDLRSLTFKAVRAMAQDPRDSDAPMPADLSADLHVLAGALLPDEILHGDWKPSLVLVSTDDYLSLLAFETLNLDDAGGYRPFLAGQDIAYLRSLGADSPAPAEGKGIILANPIPPARVSQRYGLQPLNRVVSEAEVILSFLPTARLLKAGDATKGNLTSAWEYAPFIYTAAHFVRDPEAPYLAFLPLSNPDYSDNPKDSYLYIEDIRAADLSGCGLVVLSGCASGAPYLLSDAVAPSLGDAFLDAGAHAVIHTFWDVGDAAAEKLMRGFADRWAGRGDSPIAAICGARRELLEAGRVPHPFVWAGYSIKLKQL